MCGQDIGPLPPRDHPGAGLTTFRVTVTNPSTVTRGPDDGREGKQFMLRLPLGLLACAVLGWAGAARADTTLTIATVNNGDMVVMQKLSSVFEKQHPDIHLRWVVLEENVLRQRVTTDIATKAGQFDIVTVGNYEVPIWAKQGWLSPMDNLPASYDVDDLLKPVRDGLTYEGKLYGLPFYAESAMTYYRTDLFNKAGLKMPDSPTYQEIRGFADKITDKPNQVYGMCLRGKPGWGENMAYVTTLVDTFGGQWFDMKWNPTINTPEWKKAVTFYGDILKADGPPGATSNGFNENLALFASGHCGMWIDSDRRLAACSTTRSEVAGGSDKVGFTANPDRQTSRAARPGCGAGTSPFRPRPRSTRRRPSTFVAWATSKEYVKLVAAKDGWVAVPPGTRSSTYDNPDYKKAAPFAGLRADQAILHANPSGQHAQTRGPTPARSSSAIPEFQAHRHAGRPARSAAALVGQIDGGSGARRQRSRPPRRTMQQAGYHEVSGKRVRAARMASSALDERVRLQPAAEAVRRAPATQGGLDPEAGRARGRRAAAVDDRAAGD